MSFVHAIAEVIWIESLLKELHVQLARKTTLWCDNSSTVAMLANSILHSKFKHVELDLFFVHEKVATCQLVVGYVPAQDQVADVLMKPLPA
ncbi:putative N-acetyl-gamma-glutamyl-phosphate reductase, chloroplastic [Gossypium australe]|uniref:Putative N-acetyl-gamma-glutamyl-phosphate reductase, chloroplastic n=1 Tax=Gossypium australe TaxID=47621 RepID=A0A5B6VJI2_9ROSI|nr:putative N-acetyl-gamma-glutamyl-phosphate reductase, chloroplastic [Gossypium australe]